MLNFDNLKPNFDICHHRLKFDQNWLKVFQIQFRMLKYYLKIFNRFEDI